MAKNNTYKIFAIFSFVYFLVYSTVLGYPKIWDDISFLEINYPYIKGIFPVARQHFNYSTWPIFKLYIEMVERVLGGDVRVYHLFNIIFHYLNALLVFYILKRFNVKHTVWICCVFLIHPIQVISVASMIQFKTILSLFFVLLSTITYLKYSFTKKRLMYFLSILLYFMSIKTKSSFIFMPLLIPIHSLIFSKENFLKSLKDSFLFCALMLYGVYGIIFTGAGLEGYGGIMKYVDHINKPLKNDIHFRISLIANNLEHYTTSFFNIMNLKPIYGRFNIALISDISKSILIGTVFILGFWKGSKVIRFSIISFFILIAPVLGVVYAPFTGVTPFSDQHLYFSIIPYSFLTFSLLSYLLRSDKLERVFFLSCMLIFSFFTFMYSKSFENSISFYRHAASTGTTSAVVYNNLVWDLYGAKRYKEIDKLFESIDYKKENFLKYESNFINTQKYLLYQKIKKEKARKSGPILKN